MSKKFVLHEQQIGSNFFYAERAFVMRKRHRESLKKPVMLGHASQTLWPMQAVHDTSQNLPDPDIFAFDSAVNALTDSASEQTLKATMQQVADHANESMQIIDREKFKVLGPDDHIFSVKTTYPPHSQDGESARQVNKL